MCNLHSGFQYLNRGGRQVFKLVLGMKTAEMQWRVGKTIVMQPPAHLPYLPRLVGPARNNKIRDLKPNALIAVYPEGIEDWLEPAPGKLEICAVAERFKIDVGAVDMPAQIFERLLVYIPV